ncbi:hypothetical protein F4778DRAFT_321507 [Xylariomycetidae sp. FL2044]|nr:hypothetical protein F4778DRAFT_321507 [Xylariomycetidae sp. FL2044]
MLRCGTPAWWLVLGLVHVPTHAEENMRRRRKKKDFYVAQRRPVDARKGHHREYYLATEYEALYTVLRAWAWGAFYSGEVKYVIASSAACLLFLWTSGPCMGLNGFFCSILSKAKVPCIRSRQGGRRTPAAACDEWSVAPTYIHTALTSRMLPDRDSLRF